MEFFILLFLLTVIATLMFFFKTRILEGELKVLKRRYRTNGGTDLRVAYDEIINDYNALVKRANKVLKDHNTHVRKYNELLARHLATLNNQSYTPPKSGLNDNDTIGPNQFSDKEWKRVLYALHPDRNNGKTNELWQKMKVIEQSK